MADDNKSVAETADDTDVESKPERKRYSEVIKEDARKTGRQISSKIKATSRRPVYVLFVVIGVGVGIAAQNVTRRVIDSFMQEPQVVQLDTDLKAASTELRQSADEIAELVDQIEDLSTTDPALKSEFAALQERLVGLTTLVKKTSAQTEKVAVISEALREDWQRNRQSTNRKVDSVPDLVLRGGEAVRVCNGIASIGLLSTNPTYGTAEIKVKDWTYRVKPAQRVPLEGGATIDFVGLDEANARLNINCP